MSRASFRDRYFDNKEANNEDETKRPNLDYWKSKILEYLKQIQDNVPPTDEKSESDVYVGTSGVAYLFYRLTKSPVVNTRKNEFVSKGLEYVYHAEKYFENHERRKPIDRFGFLIGESGCHAVAAILYFCAGDKEKCDEHIEKFVELRHLTDPKTYPICLDRGGNELLVGRCGYLLGALWMEKELNRPVLTREQIHCILSYIVNEGREYSKYNRSSSPLQYAYYLAEYIGAAHGLSSILLTLLLFDDYLKKHPDIERDVKLSTDWLLSLESADGNFPAATDEIPKSANVADYELVHWCHGAPGVVYLMAKAYLYWRDEKYLNSCVRSAELVWQKGLLKKGPGICHGVAGNAYVFLILYRLTNDPKYLHRATVFAEFTQSPEFQSGARTPHNPFSLFEGTAGTVCFLLDLLQPEEAAFPFMDIF